MMRTKIFLQSHDRSPLLHASEPVLSHAVFTQAVLEGLIDGIIIIATDGEVIQFNRRADQLCHTLDQSQPIEHSFNDTEHSEQFALPAAIWRVCEMLSDSNELFPNQKVMPESEVLLDSTIIRIRVQWLTIHAASDPSEIGSANLGHPSQPCMLVTLEDCSQTLHNVAMTDIREHGLTRREGEIWQLRLLGKSYREIATQLHITENTVRTHIKNILSKRRIGGVQTLGGTNQF